MPDRVDCFCLYIGDRNTGRDGYICTGYGCADPVAQPVAIGDNFAFRYTCTDSDSGACG